MVTVSGVLPASPAFKAGIRKNDVLRRLNGHEINDVLDYYFYASEESVAAELTRGSEAFSCLIQSDGSGECGMEFETFLMDKKRSCRNNCIFCFIDQNPKGMRETVYFKDDDERLSFFQGSYVTLTNLSQKDIDRVIKMRISPINISVHTMNPALRVKMLGNRFAGEVLKYIDDISEAGIAINAQIVLCRGWNDGSELEFTLSELLKRSGVQSIAVVPCGLTRHREGLTDISPFTKEEAESVIDTVERFASRCMSERDERVCFCSDEFYLTSEREMPPDEYYDGYPQLDNGVGLIRNHREEYLYALENTNECVYNRSIGIITGKAAEAHINSLIAETKNKFPRLDARVYAIRNDFYGERVTVSGLVTGGDIIKQLSGVHEDIYLIPRNMLRAEGDLFLDGISLSQLREALKAPVYTVDADGNDLCEKVTT